MLPRRNFDSKILQRHDKRLPFQYRREIYKVISPSTISYNRKCYLDEILTLKYFKDFKVVTTPFTR